MHGREGATRARGQTHTGDDTRPSRGTRRRIVVVVTALTLSALAALAIAPTVQAHAYLEAATPAPHSHAALGTTVVALRFGEAIDPHLTTIELLDGNDRPVPGSLLFPTTRPFEVRFVTDPLPEDTYTVHWRTFGRDGDLVSGHYTFAAGQAPLSADNSPTDATTGQPDPQPRIHTAAEVVARATWSIAVALLVGLPIFESRVVNAGRVHDGTMRLITFAAIGAPASLGMLYLLLGVSIGTPLAATATTDAGRLLAIRFTLALVAAGLVAWAAKRHARRRATPLTFAALLTVVAVGAQAAGGHGVNENTAALWHRGHVALLVLMAHVTAAGVWIGGVAGLIVHARHSTRDTLALLVRRFTPWAVTAVAVVAGGGIYLANVHVPAGTAPGTPYVLVILAKSILLTLLVAFGWYHARMVGGTSTALMPDRTAEAFAAGLHASSGPDEAPRQVYLPRAPRSLRAEAGVFMVVLTAAALLAALPLPAAPLSDDAPAAVRTHEAQAGVWNLAVELGPDPLVAGASQHVTLHVVRTDFAPIGALAPRIAMWPVDEPGHVHSASLDRTGDGTWHASGDLFDHPGEWSVRVTWPGGPDLAAWTVPVQGRDNL